MIERLKNKDFVIKLVVLLFVVIVVVSGLTILLRKEYTGVEYFTDEPDTWVHKDRNSLNEEDKYIDVYKATKTSSFFFF